MQLYSYAKREKSNRCKKKKKVKLYSAFIYSRSLLFHTPDSIDIVTVREHLTKMYLTIMKKKKTEKKEKTPANY